MLKFSFMFLKIVFIQTINWQQDPTCVCILVSEKFAFTADYKICKSEYYNAYSVKKTIQKHRSSKAI